MVPCSAEKGRPACSTLDCGWRNITKGWVYQGEARMEWYYGTGERGYPEQVYTSEYRSHRPFQAEERRQESSGS